MRNFKYAISGLSKRFFITLVTLIQIAISLFFLNYALSTKINLDRDVNRITGIFKEKNIYYLLDKSDEEALFNYELVKKDAYDRLNKLYRFLNYNDAFEFTSFTDSTILIKDYKGDKKFLANESLTSDIRGVKGPFSHVKGFYIDDNFLKLFKLEVAEGRLFNEADFNTRNAAIPIILGADYKGIYKIGDVIDVFSVEKEVFKVIGFLKKDYYFISGLGVAKTINMNNYIIAPFKNDINKEDIFIPQFDTRIFSSFIITDNITDAFEQISKTSNELNLYTLDYGSAADRLKYLIDTISYEIKYTTLLFLIVFLFSTIGIVTSILNSIQRRLGEFGVHLLCGATVKDIALRVFYEVAIIISTAFVLVLITSILLNNTTALPWLLLTSIGMIVLLSALPIYRILKLDINHMMRRKE